MHNPGELWVLLQCGQVGFEQIGAGQRRVKAILVIVVPIIRLPVLLQGAGLPEAVSIVLLRASILQSGEKP
jgi:hypothetical protein